MGKKSSLIPKNNASDSEVKIVKIHYSNEDYVSVGDLLFEYETSKAMFEVFSEFEGYVWFKISEGGMYSTGYESVLYFDSIVEMKDSFEKSSQNVSLNSSLVFSKKAIKLLDDNNVDKSIFSEVYKGKGFIAEADVHSYLNNVLIEYKPGSIKFNSDDIVIFGAGGHALQCLDIIGESKYNFVGFVANKFETDLKDKILGSSMEDLFLMFNDGLRNLVIGFGLLNDLKGRHDIYSKLLKTGFKFPNLLSKSSSISALTNIPENKGIQVFQGVVIGPRVILNENIVINSNATVSHHCEINEGAFIAPGAILAGGVTIGSYSLIGMGSALFMNIKIPSNTIIENLSNIS